MQYFDFEWICSEITGEKFKQSFYQNYNLKLENIFYFTELKCLLPEIKNGKLSKSTFPEFKEEITVKCDVGFRLNGTKTLTCNENQTYEELPTCDSKCK